MKLLLHILIMMDQTVGGQCLDTSHTCCNASLREDLETADLRSILYMGSAAELCGEVSHSYDTDLIAVLLAEERHRACLLRVLQTHNVCNHRKCRTDFFIYDRFYFLDLSRSHRGEMSEVETKSVSCHKGASLLNMSSENGSQSLMEDVGRTVVSSDQGTVLLIYLQSYRLACLEHTAYHVADVSDLSALKVDRIFYLELAVCALDHAAVADLTTHGSVERSLGCDDTCLLAVCHCVCDLILALFIGSKSYKSCQSGLSFELIISDKSGC